MSSGTGFRPGDGTIDIVEPFTLTVVQPDTTESITFKGEMSYSEVLSDEESETTPEISEADQEMVSDLTQNGVVVGRFKIGSDDKIIVSERNSDGTFTVLSSN